MAEQERSQSKGKPLEPGKEGSKPKTTTGTVPAQAAKPAPKPPAKAPPVPAAPAGPRELTQHQKQALNSAFIDNATSRVAKAKAIVGNTAEKKLYSDEEEPTSLSKTYDGATVLPELSNRDVWKAIQAPLQSRE